MRDKLKQKKCKSSDSIILLEDGDSQKARKKFANKRISNVRISQLRKKFRRLHKRKYHCIGSPKRILDEQGMGHSGSGLTQFNIKLKMEDVWNKACQAYDIPEDVTRRWFERIKQRLNEKSPDRHYHNWQELLLSKQELLQGCSASLVLASFFQYYAFDGKQPCVEKNCLAFEEFCRDASWEDVESKAVILKLLGDKTVTSVRCCDEEANKLQDMDLMILGSSPEKYKRYAGLLRLEYSHMSDAEYKQMRLKVLQALLMIPNIFATTEFQLKYEQSARTNIQQEIMELKE